MQDKLDTNLNNFGPRLRAHVEGRGTIEQAYAEIGVSRATLFNWFERDMPPPGVTKLEKLRQYLGKDAEWILDSVQIPSGQKSPDLAHGFEAEAHQLLEKVVRAAQGNERRLSWIVEQMRNNLKIPLAWRVSEFAPADILEMCTDLPSREKIETYRELAAIIPQQQSKDALQKMADHLESLEERMKQLSVHLTESAAAGESTPKSEPTNLRELPPGKPEKNPVAIPNPDLHKYLHPQKTTGGHGHKSA